MLNKFVSLLIITNLCSSLLGQNTNFIFKQLSNEYGIENSSVTCILQDHKGFIWIATQESLFRFDGYDYVRYRTIPGDSTSLSAIWVESIIEDKDQNLWIGTSYGLNLFIRDKGHFKRYFSNPDKRNSLPNNHIRQIFEDGDSLWLATRGGGISLFNKKDESFTNYQHDSLDEKTISSNHMWTIFKDSKKRLWFGAMPKDLNLFNQETQTFKRFSFDTRGSSINGIRCIFEISENDFLIGTNDGIVRFFPDKSINNHIHFYHDDKNNKSISKGEVRKIFKDSDGNIWVAAQYGLDIYNERDNSFTHIKSSKNDPTSLSSQEIWEIFQDKQGILWFGGFNGGVNVLYPQSKNFKNCSPSATDINSSSVRSVLSFAENPDSTIYVGIDHGGLILFDRQNGQLKGYNSDIPNIYNLPSNSILSLMIDKNEKLWVGAWAGGLSNYNNYDDKFSLLVPQNENYIGWHVWDVQEDSDGFIWTASLGRGIHRYNPKDSSFVNFRNDGSEKCLSHNDVWVICEDSDNNLWFGTTNGLNLYNQKEKNFEYFNYTTHKNQSLQNYLVFSIMEDSNKRLWIGTGGNGVCILDRKNKVFKSYTTKEGIADNTIVGILEDNRGNIWLSTTKGLSKIEIDKSDNIIAIYNFDKEDGLISDKFSYNSTLKSKTGDLFFGSNQGFVFFHPDSIKTNAQKPRVYLSDFLINNKKVKIDTDENKASPLKKDISEARAIILNHKQSVFTIKYAALNYIASKKNKYAYMLYGFEDNWNYVNDKREATYTNLDPGKYYFRVKASNNDGVWNDNYTELQLTILPPWWGTWWFRLIVIIFILGSSLSFYYNRIKQLKIQQKKLEDKVKSRTYDLQIANINLKKAKEKADIANNAKSTFLANMSHEIRTPMNAILGFSEVLQKKNRIPEFNQYLKAIISSGKSLNVLINDILDLSKIEARRITFNYSPVSIQHFINEIVMMFENKITGKGLGFKQFISTELPDIIIIDEIRVRQVIANLLSNAIKFTNKGEINLSVNMAACNEALFDIEFVVKDTGIGIPEDQQKSIFRPFVQQKDQSFESFGGTGLGLAISKGLVEKMDGFISLESEVGKGSKFSFILKNIEISTVQEIDKPKLESPDKRIVFEKSRILIAEDIKLNRDLIKTYLQEYDFEIIEAENGKQATKLALKHLPDLILMDVRMQVMGGIDASRIIKSNPKSQHIPIIAITATTGNNLKEEILEVCDDYLLKPVSSLDLVDVLKKFIKYKLDDNVSEKQAPKKQIEPDEIPIKEPELLYKKLKEEIEPRIEKLKSSLILNEVIALAEDIEKDYKKYNYVDLINWAKEAKLHAKYVNLKEVKRTMESFTNLLTEL